MEKETVKNYAELAYNILHKQTKYANDKQIIKDIFDKTSGNNYNEQAIVTRLTIIDRLYSTQMYLRYYGIEELAQSIFDLGENEDEVREGFISFSKEPQNKNFESIKNLFKRKYGIEKNGKATKRAISLITKYAYFQTGYAFPIHDSHVLKMYVEINEYFFPTIPKIVESNIISLY